MLKMEKEYNELYGDIPELPADRVGYLLKDANLRKCKLKVFDEIDRIRRIKWKSVSYTIYLLPKATPRPRSGKNGIFYVKGASDNRKFFIKYVANQDIPMITTPAKFECVSYLPIPSSMNIIEKIVAEMGFIYPVSKPDWDNLGKAYCDMIQNLLIYDDSLIIEGTSRKQYSVKPRIEITLSWMEDYDSNFNRKKIESKINKIEKDG